MGPRQVLSTAHELQPLLTLPGHWGHLGMGHLKLRFAALERLNKSVFEEKKHRYSYLLE